MQQFHHFCKTVNILTIILFASIGLANAQTTIEAGFSVGFNRHSFGVQDGNGILQPGIALAGTYGLPVVIKRNNWELHTGFYANDFSQSFYFTTSKWSYLWQAFLFQWNIQL
jgi:hypothetical protein